MSKPAIKNLLIPDEHTGYYRSLISPHSLCRKCKYVQYVCTGLKKRTSTGQSRDIVMECEGYEEVSEL